MAPSHPSKRRRTEDAASPASFFRVWGNTVHFVG
jgi:hypothetical protein